MTKSAPDLIEDIEWLDSTGVGATEAARRTDFVSAEAMEKWLYRHDAYPLWLRLKARDPEGAHNYERARRLRMTETPSTVEPIAALISRAQKSARKRTRSKADRLSDLVADLRQILDFEAHDDKAKADARREVESLERQLREARARLKGGGSAPVDNGPTAAEIREWARTEGVECPATGRIPNAVREAYGAATALAS